MNGTNVNIGESYFDPDILLNIKTKDGMELYQQR